MCHGAACRDDVPLLLLPPTAVISVSVLEIASAPVVAGDQSSAAPPHCCCCFGKPVGADWITLIKLLSAAAAADRDACVPLIYAGDQERAITAAERPGTSA